LAAQAGVISDVPAGELWSGYPARPHKQSLRGSAALAKLPDLLKRINALLAREDKA
jgi:UDP-3-O-[3-hydroxymyristoyl] glucosamine N-acyltransferase